MIITNTKNKLLSYVGYTNNLTKRLSLHNQSKGAKFTKGRKWIMIYSRKYSSKKKAMKEEYNLKKNYLERKKIKNKYLKSNRGFIV